MKTVIVIEVLACIMLTQKSNPFFKKGVQQYEVLLVTSQDSAMIYYGLSLLGSEKSILKLQITPIAVLSSLSYSHEELRILA